MSGCDTTSSLFGHRKTKLYKKDVLEKHLELPDVFYISTSIREDIIRACKKILAIVYGGEGQPGLPADLENLENHEKP